jgi:hypothetical protein
MFSTRGQNGSYNLESERESENSEILSDFQILTKKNPIFNITYNNDCSSESEINRNEQEKKNLIEKKDININPKFIVIKEEFKETKYSRNIIKIKRKRGREKKKVSKRNIRIHKPDSQDNILRKIHVHFLSFIVPYLNELLKYLGYKQKFLKLNYIFKRKADKTTVKELKNKSIGDIISKKISNKYRNKNKDHNKLLYNEIKDKEIIKNIFSEKYITLFKNVYYRNNKIISLKEYGKEEKVILSNDVKTYEDLLLKENSKEININKREFTKCIKRNFIPESIFLINE